MKWIVQIDYFFCVRIMQLELMGHLVDMVPILINLNVILCIKLLHTLLKAHQICI